jgi:hypothetical protein
MRVARLVICLVLLCAPALGETISVTEVGTHVGRTVTVEGVVSGVYTARSGVTFIDMGGPHACHSGARGLAEMAWHAGRSPIRHRPRDHSGTG